MPKPGRLDYLEKFIQVSVPETGTQVDELARANRDRRTQPTLASDASPLPLGSPAPHAVVDAVDDRVLQTWTTNLAALTYLSGDVDTDTVIGEEHRRRLIRTVASFHPPVVHHCSHMRTDVSEVWFVPKHISHRCE